MKATIAYGDAVEALHALGRALEAIREWKHAQAARADGDHYAELYKQAKQVVRDAQQLEQRGVRHLRAIAKKTRGANDAN